MFSNINSLETIQDFQVYLDANEKCEYFLDDVEAIVESVKNIRNVF